MSQMFVQNFRVCLEIRICNKIRYVRHEALVMPYNIIIVICKKTKQHIVLCAYSQIFVPLPSKPLNLPPCSLCAYQHRAYNPPHPSHSNKLSYWRVGECQRKPTRRGVSDIAVPSGTTTEIFRSGDDALACLSTTNCILISIFVVCL